MNEIFKKSFFKRNKLCVFKLFFIDILNNCKKKNVSNVNYSLNNQNQNQSKYFLSFCNFKNYDN